MSSCDDETLPTCAQLTDLQTGRVYDCDLGRALVAGRARGDSLPDIAAENSFVSRRHCTLTALHDGSMRVEDHSSSGTSINGVKIDSIGIAKPGDTILLGSQYALRLLEPREDESLIGKTIDGRYAVLREVGRGGMGAVYEVRDVKGRRICALKILEGLATRRSIERFRREAKVARMLGGHPSIVRVHEAGTWAEGQVPYFTMDLVGGPNLRQAIRDGLEVERGCRLVIEAAHAVAYAHEQGIVHRDLKPENVILTPDGHGVRLTDFGIAKLGDSQLTRTGTSLGTPSYVAPEQIRDSKRAQPSADIYGLGGILYTILTKRPPYNEASASETIVAVLKGQLVSPREIAPEVPEAIAAVCVRALALDPADRPATAKAFAEELEQALAH